MPSHVEGSSAVLRAAYKSPSGTKQFQHDIPTPAVEQDGVVNSDAKTNYLSKLRLSSKKLQEDINIFLTDKMEEDKKASGLQQEKAKDELEEENYGEEPAEDET